MNAVARFFLRAKHWQIFIFFFVLFLGANVALMISILTKAPATELFGKADMLYGGVMLLFTICFVGWFQALGSFLSSLVDPAFRLKSRFFRFAAIYVLLYMPVLLVVLERIATTPWLLAVMFPPHLFAVYCIFYLLYFVSKSLVLAETSKPASFYDYSGPFFLLWFFPIGVWIVQPRINRLYETSIMAAHQGQ